MMETIKVHGVELDEEQVRHLISDMTILYTTALKTEDQDEIMHRYAALNRWQAIHQVMQDN